MALIPTIEIFCCYARKDQQLLQELKKHLMPMQRSGQIRIWADTDIDAGEEWKKEINKHLNTAQIILLLISPDFIASDYSYSIEMKRALERHQQGEARVIPIILRPTDWQNTPLDFALVLLAFGLLVLWKLPPWLVVLISALLGLAISLL